MLKSQIDLYNAGGGDNANNLFSQLKVYRGAMLVDTKQWLRKGIENKLETIKNILNDDKLKAFKSSENHIIVNPPSNAYTTSAELSTYFYISFFSSILCVCLLFYSFKIERNLPA